MLRRSAAVVARHQRTDGAVRALPPREPSRRSRARGGRLRWGASRRRACAEVRRAPLAGPAAGRLDAEPVRGSVSGRGLPRPGSPSRVAATRPRIRSGPGSGTAPQRERPACSPGAPADPPHAHADGASCRAAPSQHARCVRTRPSGPVGSRLGGRARRRCQHDGGHARGVRERPACDGCGRGPGCYSGASRAVTALRTSAAMASFDRSPSSTIQPSAAA